MTDLLPNKAAPAIRGTNVKTPISLLGGESYRLMLCPELGSSTRSVLMVMMTLQFQFQDGVSKAAASKGKKLTWSMGEKGKFASDFVTAVKDVWNNKFRITTTSTVLIEGYRDVGVQFGFTTYIDGWHLDDHFELSVAKIDPGSFQSSCVMYTLGNSYLDSEDLVPVSKGATMNQRGAVHEFGHMLGLNDEYPQAKANKWWTGDTDSVMHSGETVRPRHYAPFAAWLTREYAYTAHLAKMPIVYKVEGKTDMSNAGL